MKLLAIVLVGLIAMAYESMIVGGSAYIIFWLNHSGWWFILTIMFAYPGWYFFINAAKPSAGSVRAAEAIEDALVEAGVLVKGRGPGRAIVSDIIDRETGAAELIAMLKRLIQNWSDKPSASANALCGDFTFGALREARAPLARLEAK